MTAPDAGADVGNDTELHVPPEGHHDRVHGGTARAAIFGVSDGLVTNISLILGVVGAAPNPGVVRLAGIASLLAGAFSMAAGEYISVTAQRELYEGQLASERHELQMNPRGEQRELEMLYESRGVEPHIAREVAASLMRNPELALETHAREELGIDPQAIGSAKAAALSSFLLFAIGAALPLIPWLFTSGLPAVIGSVVITAVAALSIGVMLARFTGRSRVSSAVRQLSIATVAAAVTYGVGVALGVTVS